MTLLLLAAIQGCLSSVAIHTLDARIFPITNYVFHSTR